MFFNQQVTEQRVLGILTLRRLGLMAFLAAAVLLVGCQSAPEEQQVAQSAPPAAAPPSEATGTADDMTATEAAIAAMNEPAPAG
jgi:hypothetical protein